MPQSDQLLHRKHCTLRPRPLTEQEESIVSHSGGIVHNGQDSKFKSVQKFFRLFQPRERQTRLESEDDRHAELSTCQVFDVPGTIYAVFSLTKSDVALTRFEEPEGMILTQLVHEVGVSKCNPWKSAGVDEHMTSQSSSGRRLIRRCSMR